MVTMKEVDFRNEVNLVISLRQIATDADRKWLNIYTLHIEQPITHPHTYPKITVSNIFATSTFYVETLLLLGSQLVVV